MNDIKYCQRCGAVISDLNTADYFSHIRIKYCRRCAEQVEREQTAVRVAALRRRKKQKDKFRDEQLILLQEENELLRKNIIRLREMSGCS